MLKLPILILLMFSNLVSDYEENISKEANPFIIESLNVNKMYEQPMKFDVALNETNLKKEVKILSVASKRPNIPDIPLDEEVLDYMFEKSEEYEISYELLLAIAKVESDFGRVTVGKNRNGTFDSGLLQINSSNKKWLSELAGIENVDLHNYRHNIDMAVALFDYERQYWRDLEYSEEDVFWLSIYGYHRGRGNTIKMAAKTAWRSSYVDKVIKIKYELEESIE